MRGCGSGLRAHLGRPLKKKIAPIWIRPIYGHGTLSAHFRRTWSHHSRVFIHAHVTFQPFLHSFAAPLLWGSLFLSLSLVISRVFPSKAQIPDNFSPFSRKVWPESVYFVVVWFVCFCREWSNIWSDCSRENFSVMRYLRCHSCEMSDSFFYFMCRRVHDLISRT